MRGKFEVQKSQLESIHKQLERLNGTVSEHTDCMHKLETRVVRMETQVCIAEKTNKAEQARIRKMQEKQEIKISDLAQKYGTITLSVLLLINMIGNWLGWW